MPRLLLNPGGVKNAVRSEKCPLMLRASRIHAPRICPFLKPHMPIHAVSIAPGMKNNARSMKNNARSMEILCSIMLKAMPLFLILILFLFLKK